MENTIQRIKHDHTLLLARKCKTQLRVLGFHSVCGVFTSGVVFSLCALCFHCVCCVFTMCVALCIYGSTVICIMLCFSVLCFALISHRQFT